MNKNELLASGRCDVGCNYWASHAGTQMWSDWRPEVVAIDLKQLADDAGLKIVRIFPLWSDFQPLKAHFGGGGHRMEMRFGEEPLRNDPLGAAGIDPVMMDRFAHVLNQAADNGLDVIVSLLTGWMSGRLFVPPALENLNLLSDPFAVKWELKFVKAFIDSFKGHSAIAAWEFGNECNCMGSVANSEEAYVWAANIAGAIRSVDPSRPLLSGMHGVQTFSGAWLIEDQADICDALTTHPYPLFTPHCRLDPLDGLRGVLHATAESRLYADVGGKPCLVEEIGSLGPQFGSEEVIANYARASLASCFAHDCRGFLWWCAYDQGHLERTPYDWNACERELGVIRENRRPKPLAGAFKEFRAFQDGLSGLPPHVTEAVCVLTNGQDNWGAAYASFILAKQAGFDIEFQKAGQPLKKSSLYLLPSMMGGNSPTRGQWLELLAAVEAGAELYMSIGDALISPFEKITGLRSLRRSAGNRDLEMTFDFMEGAFHCPAPVKMELETVGAEIRGRETDGNPAFSSFKLGDGTIHFLAAPLETALVATPGGFDDAPWWRLYREIAKRATSDRALAKDASELGITEHPENDDSRIAVLINHSPKATTFEIAQRGGWEASETIWGEKPERKGDILALTLPANGVVALRLRRGSKGQLLSSD